MQYFSGVQSFWPVKNNQTVIDAIKKLASLNIALSIPTNLSTTYKNIPRNKLKNVMRELIKFCFKSGEKTGYSCNKIWCNWTDNKN